MWGGSVVFFRETNTINHLWSDVFHGWIPGLPSGLVLKWAKNTLVLYPFKLLYVGQKTCLLYVYIYIYSICIYVWISCNISLTWNLVIWGWFPSLIIVPGFGRNVRSLNFYPDMYVCIIYIYIFIYLLSYLFIYIYIYIINHLYAYVFTPHILGDSFSHDPSFLQSQGPPGRLQAFGVARVTRVTWPLRRCESMGQ